MLVQFSDNNGNQDVVQVSYFKQWMNQDTGNTVIAMHLSGTGEAISVLTNWRGQFLRNGKAWDFCSVVGDEVTCPHCDKQYELG